ncbi:major facilitator superfamily domain-containing protein [Suillus subalutaceus]|uniref:major facilitator superfamily domain-containing protein n=1 Tax=Suillus subalutaceus TaxID=48586 RepID=UPI001B873C39|nr:major facilitator superfamily domain-containing protein [Suillus subalutaceus]KAG1860223.1 major facilitator superfamily domain-containing protein [Suillus subalutaceus]
MTVDTKPQTFFAGPPAAQEHKEGSEELGVEYPVSEESDLPLVVQEFPEGGLAAWSTAFGSRLILFCSLGYTSSFGVYRDFYTEHYLTHETSFAISFIGSFNGSLGSTLRLISGSLYDRGYFYHLVITGSLLQSFSLFMLSLAKPNQYFQVFLTHGLGSGIALGLLHVPSLAIVSHYFKRRRTLVMTFATLGSLMGAIVYSIMLNNLLNGRVGFANGVRASAGLTSVLLLVAYLCMRTRLDSPTTPVNYIAAAKKCLRDVPFIFAIVRAFLFLIGLYYPTSFLQLDSMKHGIDTTFLFYSLVIVNASSSVGRVTAGYIAAFTGVLNLIVIAAISCGSLILGMIGLGSLTSVVILGVLFGYCAGVYDSIVGPLVATLTPNPSELGGWIYFFVGGFGNLIGNPISGALLTSKYIWWKPALFSGIVSLAGAAMYIFMQFIYIRRQKKDESTRERQRSDTGYVETVYDGNRGTSTKQAN